MGVSPKMTAPDRMGIQTVGIIIPFRVAGCKLKYEDTRETPMKWWVYDADDIHVMTVQW